MLRDLDQMQSMLSFLRNGRKLDSMTLVDIAITLQLVSDQLRPRSLAVDQSAFLPAT